MSSTPRSAETPDPTLPRLEPLEDRRLLHAGHELSEVFLDAGAKHAYTDSTGQYWFADTAFKQGQGKTVAKKFQVKGTGDDSLYYSYRYGKNFNYSIPLANAEYTVKLYFTEPTHAAGGKRRFHVFAEGKQVIKSFDIAKKNGGKTAVARTAVVKVVDQALDLRFRSVKDRAMISAIEVVEIDKTPEPPPPPPPPPDPEPGESFFTRINWGSAASSPIPRAESLGGFVYGKLYVLGGFSGPAGPVKRSDVYDPATNSWSRIADLPTRLTHAGTAIAGRHIYVAGGYTGKGDAGYDQVFAVPDVWRYSTDSDAWTAMPPLPVPRGSGALVHLNGKLHFFGGVDLQRKDRGEHFVLDLANGTSWTTAAPMPNPRSHMGYTALGGKIYAVGGQHDTDERLTTQNSVHRYDPATDQWTEVASLPKAISHISSSTIEWEGRIVVLGGETAHGQSTADVVVYDPKDNRWTSLTSLSGPRNSGVAGVLGTTIYYATGGTAQLLKGTGVRP